MPENKHIWTVKLDWLNILGFLNLSSITEIPQLKKQKAIARISKTYGIEVLLDMDPSKLDNVVANELKVQMKKELAINAKQQERLEKEIQSKMMPFKRGGIVRINAEDFKDLDPNAKPKDILKYFYKKLMGEEDDQEEDDQDRDGDKFKEDNSGYYI